MPEIKDKIVIITGASSESIRERAAESVRHSNVDCGIRNAECGGDVDVGEIIVRPTAQS